MLIDLVEVAGPMKPRVAPLAGPADASPNMSYQLQLSSRWSSDSAGASVDVTRVYGPVVARKHAAVVWWA